MRLARYPVARLSELEPDVARRVPLGDDGGECAIALHQGKCYAFGSLCPHQNAPLDGARIDRGRVTCRRHGYGFDLSSGDCTTVGGYGIPLFPVEVKEDVIYVLTWEYD